MKIVIRSGVFETNSSSVHSYTGPIKSERISFKDWARSKADKDKVVNIDFGWWIDETGDVSPDNSLTKQVKPVSMWKLTMSLTPPNAHSLTTRIFVTMMNIWVRERNVGCL